MSEFISLALEPVANDMKECIEINATIHQEEDHNTNDKSTKTILEEESVNNLDYIPEEDKENTEESVKSKSSQQEDAKYTSSLQEDDAHPSSTESANIQAIPTGWMGNKDNPFSQLEDNERGPSPHEALPQERKRMTSDLGHHLVL